MPGIYVTFNNWQGSSMLLHACTLLLVSIGFNLILCDQFDRQSKITLEGFSKWKSPIIVSADEYNMKIVETILRNHMNSRIICFVELRFLATIPIDNMIAHFHRTEDRNHRGKL